MIRWCLAGKPDFRSNGGLALPQVGGPSNEPNKTLNRGSVISAASTGIAALLLIGGGTVHRQFYVPKDLDDDTQPKVDAHSNTADYFRNVDLIIIDVSTFQKCYIFLFRKLAC